MSFLSAESLTTHLLPFDAPDDLETSILIAKLTLEDISEVTSSRKGKRRADLPSSDEEIAYQVQKEEFTKWLTFVEDLKFVQSMNKAVASDRGFLDSFSAAEAAELEDRRAAEMLSRGQQLPPPSPVQQRLEDPAFSLEPEVPKSSIPSGKRAVRFIQVPTVRVFHGPTVQEDAFAVGEINLDEQYLLQMEILSWQGSCVGPPTPCGAGPSIDRKKLIECIICSETLRAEDAFHTSCNHDYCRACVRGLVKTFIRDESLFPLRCCQEPIPIDSIYPFIKPRLRKLLDRKNNEYIVLAKDRLYCIDCSTFLGSSEAKSSQREVLCRRRCCPATTCPMCKEAGHIGADCAVSEATTQARLFASEQGWQTCPVCQTVVELDVGCYHITCTCRTEFCYLCAALWENCACPQWDEARLLETARRRVENELGTDAVRNTVPAALEARVQARAQTLHTNNICESHSWMYRSGGGECEECHSNIQDFVFTCIGCSLLACKRCTRNRL